MPSVRPEWSFEDVVQAGWDNYIGGGIESAGRRLVLIRVWAGLVGRDRALAEFDAFVRGYGGRDNAAKRLNIAVSTLARLRREFEQVDSQPPAMQPSLRPRERVEGRGDIFIVEDEIGAGGMGHVFRGRRHSTGELVALKLLSTDRFVVDERVRQRFLRESSIAQQFNHRNLVRSFEAVLHRGLLVSVMEYVEGETLQACLTRERLLPQVGVPLMIQLATGLAELHQREIVHRDLTPKNIIFRASGEAALCDFGVARLLSDPTLTRSYEQMGSLIYISPQQRETPHETQTEDDVYSLGQILFYIITGVNPHNAGPIADHQHEYPHAVASLAEEMRRFRRRDRPRDGGVVLARLHELGNR